MYEVIHIYIYVYYHIVYLQLYNVQMWISTHTHSVSGNENLYVFASKSNGRRFGRGSLVDKSINPQAKNHHMSPRCHNMSQGKWFVESSPFHRCVLHWSKFGRTLERKIRTVDISWPRIQCGTDMVLIRGFKLGNVSATRQAIPDRPSSHWGDASTALHPESHSPARWFGTPSLERGTRNQTERD
jgi:hypothetical protein